MGEIERFREETKKNLERADKVALSDSPLLTEKQRRRAKMYRERQLGKLEALDELAPKS